MVSTPVAAGTLLIPDDFGIRRPLDLPPCTTFQRYYLSTLLPFNATTFQRYYLSTLLPFNAATFQFCYLSVRSRTRPDRPRPLVT